MPGPAVQEHPFEGLPEDPFGDKPLNVSAELAIEKEGAAAEHGLPDDPFGDAVEFQSKHLSFRFHSLVYPLNTPPPNSLLPLDLEISGSINLNSSSEFE